MLFSIRDALFVFTPTVLIFRVVLQTEKSFTPFIF